jgi:hypothetical protein
MGDLIQLIGVSTVSAAGLILVIGATIRFALGPIVRAKRLAAAAAATPPDTARIDARMDALEEEVRRLGDAVDRVAAVAEFDAQLRAGSTPPPTLPPG